MAEFNQVLWALDNEIQPRSFERLCLDLLGRAGCHLIVPIGGSKDHGTARLVAFVAGYCGVPDEILRENQKENWKEVGAEIGVRLMEQILKDWEMIKPK